MRFAIAHAACDRQPNCGRVARASLGHFERGAVAFGDEERHAALWAMMQQVSTCIGNLKFFRPSILVWDKGLF